LLRVLSDGHFYRVGGHNAIKANPRVIAATHQDLEQRVKEGVFREDLYHRLNVIRLRLPALRERREDVFALTRHFLQQSAKQLGVEPKRISDAALQQLSTFAFPGNVRQLENICHWLTVMAPAQVIEPKDLPPEVLGAVREHSKSAGDAGASKTTPPKTDVTELHASSHHEASAPMVAHAASALAAGTGSSGHAPSSSEQAHDHAWESGLEVEAQALLATGRTDVWDVLTRRFESKLIQTALLSTRGRRIEAAQKLGIGRNTITRKIQELNLE
jgi:two-component system nitrogen regulation response regulator GlnG